MVETRVSQEEVAYDHTGTFYSKSEDPSKVA